MISRTQDGYQLEAHALKAISGKGLAPRELISILYKAAGLKTKEISEEMDCAITTANKRQQTINFKLNAKNSAQAVSEAFRRGIIIHYLIIITSAIGAATADHSEMARHRAPRAQTKTQSRTGRESSSMDIALLLMSSQRNEVTI